MCFFSKQFCLSEKNSIFDLTSRLGLAGPNWVENRPFSFDSHVATIERRKIVIQPTYCISFPCPKPTISRILDQSNFFAVNKIRVFSHLNFVGQWVKLLFLPCAISPNFIRLRISIKEDRSFKMSKVSFGQMIWQSSKNYSKSLTLDKKNHASSVECVTKSILSLYPPSN